MIFRISLRIFSAALLAALLQISSPVWSATVTVQAYGEGNVTSSVGDMDCSGLTLVPCSITVTNGTSVTLTGHPLTNRRTAWGKDCLAANGQDTCTFVANVDKNVITAFPYPEFQAAIIVDNDNTKGTVRDARGRACGNLCVFMVPLNEATWVNVDAAPGYVFDHWEGSDCTGTQAFCNLTMSQNRFITARYRVAVGPVAASNLRIEATYGNEIDLRWTDNSPDEEGFLIESAPTAGGPWTELPRVGYDITFYPHTNLVSGQTYFYRIRSYNIQSFSFVYSSYSNVVSAATTALTPAADQSGARLFVFAYPAGVGVPVPTAGLDLFCSGAGNTSLPQRVDDWLKREATKYGIGKPYSSTTCLRATQVALPTNVLEGGSLRPIKLDVIAYLEQHSAIAANVTSAKYVTVFYYYPSVPQNDFPSGWVDSGSAKYSFAYFYPWPEVPPQTAVEFAQDVSVANLNFELFSGMGATRKFFGGLVCENDPATQQPVTGYDIMCARVTDTGGAPHDSTSSPQPHELIVSPLTAKEIRWINLTPSAPINFRLR